MNNIDFSAQSFEEGIYTLISKCLTENETIKYDKDFDFFLPNGVKKLSWPKNTYIEIKYRLMYDSFSRIRMMYDKIENREKNLIVIFLHKKSFMPLSDYLNNRINNCSITFLSYIDFQRKVDKTGNYTDLDIGIKNEQNKEEKNAINIEKAKKAIKNNRISLFLGAGVSISAGMVNWENLLKKLCAKRNLGDIKNKKYHVDEIVKGRCIIDSYKKEDPRRKELRNEIEQESDTQKRAILEKLLEQNEEFPDGLYQDMKSILYNNIKSKRELIVSIVDIIKNAHIESIITYNYDDLVEQEIKKRNHSCHSVYEKSRPFNADTVHVYHVHGFIPQNQNEDYYPIVLGEKEYHKIYQDSYNWSNVEQLNALNRSTCFFIGLSMIDPNLRRLLDISKDGGEEDSVHYIFLCRDEFNVSFMENTMLSFGINCIWYDNHNDLPNLLRSLI